MQGLILAGGKGTRLRPLTVYTPKPVVPIVNRPFVLFQLEKLAAAGITDVTLSLSYQPDKIQHILGDGSDYGVRLRYVTEPSPMGTGGAFKFASEIIDETTVVLNGDILTNADIGKIVAFHAEKEADASLALAPTDRPELFGLVETDSEGRITKFTEKPPIESIQNTGPHYINAGIYVLEPAVLEMIDEGVVRSFEYDVFPQILSSESPFYGYKLENEYWRDIGTPESYLEAHRDLLSRKITGFEFQRRGTAEFATSAYVDAGSVIAEDCLIKPGARITNSILGTGVHVEEKAVIDNSVIWAHSRISSAAEVSGAIIGRSCHIGRNVTVSPGSVLGDKTTLTDYTKV